MLQDQSVSETIRLEQNLRRMFVDIQDEGKKRGGVGVGVCEWVGGRVGGWVSTIVVTLTSRNKIFDPL